MCECPPGSAILDKECLECFAPVERCRGGTSTESDCGQGCQVSTKRHPGRPCVRCVCVCVDLKVVNDVEAVEIGHVTRMNSIVSQLYLSSYLDVSSAAFQRNTLQPGLKD